MGPAIHSRQAIPSQWAIAFDLDTGLFQLCERSGVQFITTNPVQQYMHPHDGRVVSNFIMQALRNEPITIYGNGSQTRSFCFVDDLVEGGIRPADGGIRL